MNLAFLSGPHAAGKTTRVKGLEECEPSLLVPKLITTTPKFHTEPLERIILKIGERAIENYEVLQIAKQNENKIILGNRCIYDGDAYAKAYLSLSWITDSQYKLLIDLGKYMFPEEVRDPFAIVYNPPFEVIRERLQNRWKTEEKKWKEEDLEYAKAAGEAFEQFREKEKVLYLEEWNSPSEVLPWLKERVKYSLMQKAS